eukprot:2136741-Amphidinium_carterae.1
MTMRTAVAHNADSAKLWLRDAHTCRSTRLITDPKLERNRTSELSPSGQCQNDQKMLNPYGKGPTVKTQK